MQHTPFVYGTLLSGQTVTQAIALQGGLTLFASQWQTSTLAVTLVDPNGQTIDPAYALAHPQVVSYTADATTALYSFPNATTGTWQLILQAVNVPAQGVPYMTFAAFESALTLAAGTDRNWYTPGATATITATFTGSLSGAAITATLLYASGVSTTVSLSPSGAQQYQATVVLPNTPGYAEARLAATGTLTDGSSFERGTNLVFQISPQSIALNHVYSDVPQPRFPGASLYQALTVTTGITSAISGTVGLSADLVDASSNLVAHSLTIQNVITGTSTLTLRFDGDDIYASGGSGPYTLTNLLLTDQRGATLTIAEAQKVYVTAAYDYRNFAPANTIYLPLVLGTG